MTKEVNPMPESITASNAAQSAYFAKNSHDVAYPEWNDLTTDEQREMIAQGHPLAAAEDRSSSASSQHFIDTGRYLTNREMFEFEEIQADPEPEPVRDLGDVTEEYLTAWQNQNNRAYIVAVSLRVAMEAGLEIPAFLRTEFERFEEAERKAVELGEVMRTHPTHVANLAAVENRGD